MNQTKRKLLAACVGATVAVSIGIPGAYAQAKYVAKVGHLEQATQPRHKGLEKVAQLVTERTKGEVEFKLFPASQLGNARQMMEGVQFGTIEATVMPAAFIGGFNPAISVLDIPYLFPTDRGTAQQLRDGLFGKALLDSFAARGFTPIALWPNGRKSLTSNKALDSIEAMRGQKFRVMDSKILIEQFSAVGASAVAIQFGELYTALQTGVIDGQENPLDTISTMKFHEVQKNLVVTEHGAMEDVVLFNPGFWGKLPAGHRTLIINAFNEVRPEVEKNKEEAQAAALGIIRGAKVNVRVADEAERKKLRDAMFPRARAAYLERAGAEGERLLKLYEDERRKLAF